MCRTWFALFRGKRFVFFFSHNLCCFARARTQIRKHSGTKQSILNGPMQWTVLGKQLVSQRECKTILFQRWTALFFLLKCKVKAEPWTHRLTVVLVPMGILWPWKRQKISHYFHKKLVTPWVVLLKKHIIPSASFMATTKPVAPVLQTDAQKTDYVQFFVLLRLLMSRCEIIIGNFSDWY